MKPLLLAALLATVSTAASAQEAKQDFTLVNKTGYELGKVYVAPSKSDDWDDDILGHDTLGDGASAEIKFHRADKTCQWDLKVVYTIDNTNAVWHGINLCQVEKITIRYNKSTDTTSAAFD